jgi:hypothetical protein
VNVTWSLRSGFCVMSAENLDAEFRKISLFCVVVVLSANLELCPAAKVNLVVLYLPRAVQNIETSRAKFCPTISKYPVQHTGSYFIWSVSLFALKHLE